MAASRHDLLVIPHGSSVYSYHLQYTFTNCPVAEYINLSPTVRMEGGELMGPWCRGQSKVSRVEGGELMGPWCRLPSVVSDIISPTLLAVDIV